ncbi:MAG TPA: BlaI/MecI/CopY family transcriptional regulator [Jatrophihabitantaceae bacterium]|nr:BlaI/MecI/CopY family transcriptional regulator [Jatrophihabitantaceae bacterium]
MASRSRGALEREVIACLAAADRPMTAAEVRAELSMDLAYTTVMTTLSRLHAKNAIERVPQGRAYAYSLTGGPATARVNVVAHRMLRLLDDETDRAAVLTRFVGELQPGDEQLLTELLRGRE